MYRPFGGRRRGRGPASLGGVTSATTMAGVVFARRTLCFNPTGSFRPIKQVGECPLLDFGTHNRTDRFPPKADIQTETLPERVHV